MTDNTTLQSIEMARRSLLRQSACGFGTLAASSLAASSLAASSLAANERAAAGRAESGGGVGKPVAKRVIFLFMQGSVSQVDSFD